MTFTPKNIKNVNFTRKKLVGRFPTVCVRAVRYKCKYARTVAPAFTGHRDVCVLRTNGNNGNNEGKTKKEKKN